MLLSRGKFLSGLTILLIISACTKAPSPEKFEGLPGDPAASDTIASGNLFPAEAIALAALKQVLSSDSALKSGHREALTRLRNDGYTIIDLGNPLNRPDTSAFYEAELEIVFGKFK